VRDAAAPGVRGLPGFVRSRVTSGAEVHDSEEDVLSQAQTPARHRADVPVGVRSPQELEDEIETTRDRLADTLDELLFRIKPKTVVQRQVEEVKAHFVDSQGKVRTEKVAAVAGAAVGVVAFFAVVRKLSKG
jgi:Protein of unknown function (DUF3618)